MTRQGNNFDTAIGLGEKLKLAVRILGDPNLSHAEARTALALLLKFHNNDTGLCVPSVRGLAEASASSRSAAQRSTKALEKVGYLGVVRNKGRAGNRYRFNECPTQAGQNGIAECPTATGRNVPQLRDGMSHPSGTEPLTNTLTNKLKKIGGAEAPATKGVKIAFKGKFVKSVSEANLSCWLQNYPTLDRQEALAELATCDDYFSTGAEKVDGTKWFFRASSWLKRTHLSRLKANEAAKEAEDAIYRGVL
jgi:hypothetical protein